MMKLMAKMHLYCEDVTLLILIASQSEQIGILRNGSQGPELVEFESMSMIGTNPGEKSRVVVLNIFLYKNVPQSDSLGFAWKGCCGQHLNVYLYHKYLAFEIILNELKLKKMSLTKLDSIKMSK